MTSKEITSVAIKVFAIYALVQAIFSVPVMVNALAYFGIFERGEANALLLLLPGIVSFFIVVTLVIFLWKLANSLVEQSTVSPEDQDDRAVTADFLISLVGFYLVLEGLIQFGYSSITSYTSFQETRTLSIEQNMYVIGNLVQIAIGLALIVKAQRWVSFLNWLRSAGLNHK